jgi:hypothetical protein
MVYVYISTVCISTLTAHVGYLYYRFHIYIYIKFGGRVEFGYSLKLLVLYVLAVWFVEEFTLELSWGPQL